MPLAPYPHPFRGHAYTVQPDGTLRDQWSTRCADCNLTMTRDTQTEAQLAWWQHIQDQHPNAWAALRQDCPSDAIVYPELTTDKAR